MATRSKVADEIKPLSDIRKPFLDSLGAYQYAAATLADMLAMILDESLPGVVLPPAARAALQGSLDKFRAAQ